MSVPAFVWAMNRGRAHRLPASERMLLIAIADYANSDGDCWAGQETLADATGLTSRSVRTLAPVLEKLGLVRIGRHGRSVHYHIVRPNGAYGDPATPEAASALTPEQASANTQQDTTKPEAASALTPEAASAHESDTGNLRHRYRKLLPLTPEAASADPKKEPRKRPKKERHPPNPPRAEGGRETVPVSFDEFWQLYPRKVGYRAAATAFAAAVNRGNNPADIINALRSYPFNANPQYQPHPLTWLRQERFRDEVDNFDPVLRAAGLKPEDFLDGLPNRGLLQ